MAKYNTLHYCTVSASILLNTGLVCLYTAGLWKSLLVVFYTSWTAFWDSFGGFNKSVLSLENKAVYGMVDKSCHKHSGLLFHVALPRLPLDFWSRLLGCTSEMVKHGRGDPSLEGGQIHFVARDIVLLLQKPLAHTRFSPRGKEDREKHTKKIYISKEIITNREEITAVH